MVYKLPFKISTWKTKLSSDYMVSGLRSVLSTDWQQLRIPGWALVSELQGWGWVGVHELRGLIFISSCYLGSSGVGH